jgi:cytosine/adenosine deaminase-related metal-dependent hydrolase
MNAATHALRARWIVPIDRPPLEGGCVVWREGRILEVTADPPAQCVDLGDYVVLPGLVNAHTHLEFSDAQRPLGRPGMPLPDWIREVIRQRKARTRDPRACVAAGLAESLAWGVTTLGEIATYEEPVDVAATTGPRIARFHEVIGFSALRSASALDWLRTRLSRFDSAATADQAAFREGVSPHAPYTVHPQLVADLADLAAAEQRPLAMHLAESREELELIQHGVGPFRDLLEERSMWDPAALAPGMRPLDYLRAMARAPRSLVVHGNYLEAPEIEFLAAHRERMTVVVCPRTHAYFQHAPHPLPQLVAAGVRVALGTDSRASNPDLDLLAECRAAWRMAPEATPDQVVRWATLGGAEALGCATECGSLTPGKRADLLAIPCAARAVDPWETLLAEPSPASSRRVWRS